MNKYPQSLVIGVCSILATAGMVGPGGFRWVLLAIAAALAVLLAKRALSTDINRN